MARLFDITTTTDVLTLGASGQGKLVFTVTNTTTKPQRGTLRARALDSAQAGWLSVSGEFERDFSAGFTHQVEMVVKVPPGTPPGRFRVRLDALSVANPEEDFTEGPAIAVVVPAVEAAEPKKSLWWVWLIVALVVLLVISVVLYLVLRDPKPDAAPPEPPASEPARQPPPPPKPVPTREFNDPRVQVGREKLALDICREWGNNCGKPAADAYCQSVGMAAAVDFRMAMDSPPTVVWSSKQVCRDPSCDRITWVKCSGTARATLEINRATRVQLQQLKLQGKQVPEQ
ncbi:MAG: hypothetical protein OEM00_05470 [Burkholderiaceae bacterium]|nr:hypothetical protein [Burkholderiaceae bacterium]